MGIKNWIMETGIYDYLGKRSFSQSGEDMIVRGEFEDGYKGVYVDVGAYHPKLFSNTYYFYRRGWKGVVVDPSLEMIEKHKQIRPLDIQVNVGVGKKEKVMEYFVMDKGATNTFDENEMKKSVDLAGRKLLEKRMVAVLPLRKILYQYLDKGVKIDLLSVDTEGMDLEVLQSMDWEKYQPKIVIAEEMEFDYKNWKKSKLVVYMDKVGYELLGITPYSLVFRKAQKSGVK